MAGQRSKPGELGFAGFVGTLLRNLQLDLQEILLANPERGMTEPAQCQLL